MAENAQKAAIKPRNFDLAVRVQNSTGGPSCFAIAASSKAAKAGAEMNTNEEEELTRC